MALGPTSVSGILFILINYAHKFTCSSRRRRSAADPGGRNEKSNIFPKTSGKNMDVIRDCASRQLAAKEFIGGEWFGLDPGLGEEQTRLGTEWKHGVVIIRRNWYDGGGGTPFQKPIENQSS